MYNEKLAVAIKSAGKVLREFKDTVYVPFGAEYSIFIKNLNSVRTIVKVSIDGQYIDETGEGFVIDANSSLDLERFLKNGNLDQGNRFKFIERTGKIEQHRGIEVEDGLVRVEYQFEKRPPKVEVEEVHHYKHHYWHDYWWDHRPYRPHIRYLMDQNSTGNGENVLRGVTGTCGGNIPQNTVSASYVANSQAPVQSYTSTTNDFTYDSNIAMDALINEAGITVAGSKSEQQFHVVSGFPVEDATHVIVLKLLGETAQGKKVKQAVTVKTKQKCPTCGHMNKATTKFCAECGTALEIV